ncbi:MAG TPA: methyltransferase domain-containing protein [Candidatus Obscuribacterales bacterium]
MLIRLLSLFRFHLECLGMYFRPGVKWSPATVFHVLRQAGYYFANECYGAFIYGAESLVFIGQRRLKTVDHALNLRYFHPSQFMLALREGLRIEKPETIYRLTYGETTFFGIRAALKAVGAKSGEVFYDLGCGTGRNVFYAAVACGMQAVGIDLLPSFVNNGKALATQFDLKDVSFLEQNIFVTDLKSADVVYITANCYDAETMPQLVKRLDDLRPGARVISTHRSIPSPRLRILRHQLLPFSWGVDKMFYQVVKDQPEPDQPAS